MRTWLKEIREKQGMTQEQFAVMLGMERTTYTSIESGYRNPSVPNAKKLGDLLDCDWTLFFENELLVEGIKYFV